MQVFCLPSKKDLSRWMIRNLKIWDENIINLIIKQINDSNSIFIDIGCNYGAYSIPISKIKNNINIISFDPSRKSLDRLDENINLNNLKKAIKLSQLEKFIDKLPNKYETYIGNRGVRLSGGQIQRIGIARCLYRNPKIIIMDEATSSLDNQAEKKILNAINNLKKGRTLIAIAHRLSTVRRADLIFFIKNGKVVDYGNYKKLKKTQSDFFTNI